MAKSMANLFASRVCRVPGIRTRPAPSLFYYAGLQSSPWHERDAAPFRAWVSDLEAASGAITDEYLALKATGRPSDYEPEGSDHGASLHQGREDWHWDSLIDRGRRRETTLSQCPQTAAALSSIPGLCEGDMPFAFAFFSTLSPGR